jgi:hypothetical protein
MFARRTLALLSATALLLAGAPLSAQDKPSGEDIKKAQKAVEADLAKRNGAGALIAPVTDTAVLGAFPGQLLFAARFPLYPVARLVPEGSGLGAQNLFAVKDGKAQLLKGLEPFFRDNLAAVKTDDAAKQAARAWLRLQEELIQDGFYKFALVEDSLKVTPEKGGRQATGRVTVTAGGTGAFSATLSFDAAGKLVKATVESKVHQGIRPICQATKLLDPDPVVRRMAEMHILVMGSAARDYLAEQRARARPELQQAIDRIWQRILDEGR